MKGRKAFAVYGSSPSIALLRKTRFRDRKMQAVNLFAALWVKKNAVCSLSLANCYFGFSHRALLRPKRPG